MSSGKKAAQAIHAADGLISLGRRKYKRVTVLEASDAEFDRVSEVPLFIVRDSGKTEVPEGTQTALAYWEKEDVIND